MNESKADKIAQNKALLEKYPILKPYYTTRPDADPYDYELTDLDCVYEGWKGIFLEACDEIMAHLKEIGEDLKKFHFFDIKEKYGSLRVDTAGYSDKVIDDILWNLEQRSMLYCPNCGAPSKCVTQGYVLYLCPECAKKSELKFDWLTKDDVPVVTVYNFETKEKTTKASKYDAQFRLQWDASSSEG